MWPKCADLVKHVTWKEKKEAWAKMCTEIRIPYEWAPKDPTWMIKKRIGERLNAQEVESSLNYAWDKKLEKLKKTAKAPGAGHFLEIQKLNHEKKVLCEFNHNCGGWNKESFEGDFGICMSTPPFFAWN